MIRDVPASIGGGGRESNPPTDSRRLTGFEDREGHQPPFASGASLRGERDYSAFGSFVNSPIVFPSVSLHVAK